MLMKPTNIAHHAPENESLVIGVRGTAALVKRIRTLCGSMTVSLFCRHAIQHFCDALDAEDPGARLRIRALCADPKRPLAHPRPVHATDQPEGANRDRSRRREAAQPAGRHAPESPDRAARNQS